MEMDISKQLHAYEVEYHVLQDELLDAGPLLDDSDRLDKLEKTNVQLKKQNMDLLEKLQVRSSTSGGKNEGKQQQMLSFILMFDH